MTARFHRLFLIILLLILLPGTAPAKTSPEHSARLKAMRDEVKILKGMQPKDTEFRSNMGIAIPQKQAELLGKKGKTEIQDLDLSEKTNKVRTEKVEKRLGKRNKQMEARKKNIKKIQEKNRKYRTLEQSLAKDEKKARARIREITSKKAQNKGKLSRKLKSELKVQRKKLVNAKVSGQTVQQNRAKIKRSRNAAQYKRLKASIAKDRKLLTRLKTSKSRGKLWKNKGGFVVGALLSALSADLEENALAEKEGRPISKTNKAYNFFKNVSGISAAEGAYTNISIAQMEAYVKTLEVYEGLGYDITDPYVQDRAANAVRKAVLRTTVYEGAKLAPVVSDMISVKEGFDAAGDAYVASEDTAWTEANNTQVRFQTSLRAAMKAEARLAELRKTAEQAKILTASLGKLKKQLLEMEKEALTDRQQVSQAIRILEAYNEQAVALQNQNSADVLAENNVSALLERLREIKSIADEQADNVERVQLEHQSGELTAQGVATQAGFISNLLQQAIQDYAALSQHLAGIKALSRGTELSAQVPRALETIKQAEGMLAQQSRLSGKLFALYKDQAGALDEAVGQHQTARKEMNKFLGYVSESKNLEDAHQVRIRDALDQANNIGIDQTAVRQALNDARGLRNSAAMVTALAGLDKAPQAVDTAKLNALTRQAQQAWGQLAGPNQQAAESIQNAQDLLKALMALAGDAEPAAIEIAEKPSDAPEMPLKGKLFAGRNWLEITTTEIEENLENHKRNQGHLHNEFFGYKTFNFPAGVEKEYDYCQTVLDQYCPDYGEMYRLLEQGKNKSEWRGTTPYWIAYKLRAGNATFTSDFSPMPKLETFYHVTQSVNRAKENNEQYKITPITLPNADEALILVTGIGERWQRLVVHARSGPLYVWHSGELNCQIGPGDNGNKDGKAELDYPEALNPTPRVTSLFDKNFIERCVSWNRAEAEIQADLLEHLLAEVNPILERMNRTFYVRPFKVDVALDGFAKERKGNKLFVEAGQVLSQEFRRKWGAPGKTHRASYGFSVRMGMPFNYQTNSWQKVMDQIDKTHEKRYQYSMNRKSPPQSVDVSIDGADHVRMTRLHRQYKNDHTISEDLFFRVRNIAVTVNGHSKNDNPESHTIAIGRTIARQILAAPKGWK